MGLKVYKRKSILSNVFDVFKWFFIGVFYWIKGNCLKRRGK
jgi:hypothetical protein